MAPRRLSRIRDAVRSHHGLAGISLGALLGMPVVRTVLEQTMFLHMLVQIPALVAAGLLIGRRLRVSSPRARAAAHSYRFALLFCALATATLWMIPRLLDLAAGSAWVDLVKILSLVAGVGVALALCWPELGGICRGVVHVEALATIWRLGWLYLDTPQRLCSQYLLEDQYRVGVGLIVLGIPYAVWLAVRSLFGNPRHKNSTPAKDSACTKTPLIR